MRSGGAKAGLRNNIRSNSKYQSAASEYSEMYMTRFYGRYVNAMACLGSSIDEENETSSLADREVKLQEPTGASDTGSSV